MALSANSTSAQTLGTTNNNDSTTGTSGSVLGQNATSQNRDNKSTTTNTTLVAAAAAATPSEDTNVTVNAPTNNDTGAVSQETSSSTDRTTSSTTNTSSEIATAPIADGAAATEANADTVTADAVNTDAQTTAATAGVATADNTTTETTGTNTATATATGGDADIVADAGANTDTATATEPTAADPTTSEPTTSDPATSTSTTTTPPSTTALATEGIVKASMIQPSQAGDVTGFKLTNLTAQANPSEYVTFGQAFEKGDLKPGELLVATINGQKYAVQVDAKTLNDDGSINHAILTLKAPDLAASASVDAMLSKGTAGTAGAALTANSALSGGLDVKLALTIDGSTTTLDAATVLQQAIDAGKVETWMSGSQASEFRVTAPINESLKATFDIRVYADGEIKTDVIVANEATFTSNAKGYTYDVAIREGGQTVHSETGVEQWRGSTWHKEVWKNDQPDVHVGHDMTYLAKAGAIMPVDSAIGVSATAISEMLTAMNSSDTSLMGSSLIEKYMGQTGGRGDIGPVTQWTAMYLASQDPRAFEVMMAQADAGGSIPWHYRDEATGDYARIDLHPDLWIDSRATDAQAIAGGYNPGGGWTPELAHQPSLSYVPYLVTGTHYYLDEVQAQAAFGIAADAPQYRDGANGVEPFGQIRALAWGLRDIADAMYLTPDSDPMQAYYEKILDNNLKHLVDTYITKGTLDSAKEVEGYLAGDYGTPGAMAPWQQDYVVMALGRIAEQGNEDAAALMGWMTNFVAGRFINGDYGFDPLYGPAYNLYLGTNPAYPTWDQVSDASLSYTLTELDGYPDWSGGYAAGAKGALATLITETHDVDAYEAYGYVVSQTTGMVADYANNPTFSVAPQLKDGTYLNHDHIVVQDGTLTGTATADLLHGGAGNDTANGNGGIDLLYGAGGSDTLIGGDGDDYIFGGASNDVLNGGNGNDFLRGDGGNDTMAGGAGVDTFSVDIREKAANTITDFQVGTDKIEVAHAYGADATTLAAQILAGATTDASGNVVLHLASGNDLTLDGVHAGQMTAASLFVTT